MAVPSKKRRKKLLIILSRENDDNGVLMLSKIWPIYESQLPLSLNAQAVCNEVDSYYAAYDGEDDPDDFDACTADALDSNTKGARADALEAAINTWES